MSIENINTNTNVEKKDATAVAHEIKGELTSYG